VNVFTAAPPPTETVGSPLINMAIFLAFVVVTMTIVLRVAKQNKSAADFYAGGRSFSGAQNGIAIAGDYLSAASFLGIAGAIALNGYDGFLYSIGFLVAWLVALLLVAELMRNTAKFTMADVLSFRLKQRPVRMAAALTTLSVCFFYLLAQMAGAGGLVSLLMGFNTPLQKNLTIVVVGSLMIVYVLVGGMKGTTWVQIIKAILLIFGAAVMTLWVGVLFKFNLSELLGASVDKAMADGVEATAAQALLTPGKVYGGTLVKSLNFVSLSMALVLGTAGLPHVLMRFYTVPTAKEARRSVVWAIWLIGIFYLFTLVLGFGAGALVGPARIKAAPGAANSAAPLLAYELGGTILLSVISAVAFATILAVVAGLAITAATSFAHDFYASVIKRGEVGADDEVKIARRTVVVIGVLAIIGGIFAQNQNIAFLVALAFAVAASSNLPTILYSLFWKGFTTRGAQWSMYGGLISCLGLIIFSPVMSGKLDPATCTGPDKVVSAAVEGCKSLSLVQDIAVDFHWFPLENPGIISIPLAFLLGYLGSKLDKKEPDHNAKAAEMEVRSLTGAGAERAVLNH
jgi:cation/acetate symporter